MASDHNAVQVIHNPGAHRYEATVDGHLAVAEYLREGTTIIFTHTGVPAAIEGRGVASALARAALDAARAEGLAVVPRCPFFATYIRRHPAYADLVRPAS